MAESQDSPAGILGKRHNMVTLQAILHSQALHIVSIEAGYPPFSPDPHGSTDILKKAGHLLLNQSILSPVVPLRV